MPKTRIAGFRGKTAAGPRKTVENNYLEFRPNNARENEASGMSKELTSPSGIQSMWY